MKKSIIVVWVTCILTLVASVQACEKCGCTAKAAKQDAAVKKETSKSCKGGVCKLKSWKLKETPESWASIAGDFENAAKQATAKGKDDFSKALIKCKDAALKVKEAVKKGNKSAIKTAKEEYQKCIDAKKVLCGQAKVCPVTGKQKTCGKAAKCGSTAKKKTCGCGCK